VLREATSRGQCGLGCPSRTSERGGEGDSVKEGGGGEGERELEGAAVHWGCYYAITHDLRLILNAAALAAASPTLLFSDW
jgi:hypothetical protein